MERRKRMVLGTRKRLGLEMALLVGPRLVGLAGEPVLVLQMVPLAAQVVVGDALRRRLRRHHTLLSRLLVRLPALSGGDDRHDDHDNLSMREEVRPCPSAWGLSAGSCSPISPSGGRSG